MTFEEWIATGNNAEIYYGINKKSELKKKQEKISILRKLLQKIGLML